MAIQTQKDPYSAVWVSHSSISDFQACPRAYYIQYIYKNPKTGRKITLMKPPLALGQAIHAVLDELSNIPTDKRFYTSLSERLAKAWLAVEGKRGGFADKNVEAEYRKRAEDMMAKLEEKPGPLARKALKISQELPHFWLSEEDNIILCGKIDWLEYIEDKDAVKIIDFKTGKLREKQESLQLPIYYLLAKECQKREIVDICYWYIDLDDDPESVGLPDLEGSKKEIMKAASRIKLARQLNHFKCSTDEQKGCRHCAPYEAILKGHGEFVGVGEYNKEVYVLSDEAVAL